MLKKRRAKITHEIYIFKYKRNLYNEILRVAFADACPILSDWKYNTQEIRKVYSPLEHTPFLKK